MARTEAQKKAEQKYRKNSTHSLVMNFPNSDWNRLFAYCQHTNYPVATWVRKLIWNAIDSDPTFTYIPEENGNQDDNPDT